MAVSVKNYSGSACEIRPPFGECMGYTIRSPNYDALYIYILSLGVVALASIIAAVGGYTFLLPWWILGGTLLSVGYVGLFYAEKQRSGLQFTQHGIVVFNAKTGKLYRFINGDQIRTASIEVFSTAANNRLYWHAVLELELLSKARYRINLTPFIPHVTKEQTLESVNKIADFIEDHYVFYTDVRVEQIE
jgi:hypothetical protein